MTTTERALAKVRGPVQDIRHSEKKAITIEPSADAVTLVLAYAGIKAPNLESEVPYAVVERVLYIAKKSETAPLTGVQVTFDGKVKWYLLVDLPGGPETPVAEINAAILLAEPGGGHGEHPMSSKPPVLKD